MVTALKLACRIFNATYSRAIGMAPDAVTTETYPVVLAFREQQSARKLDNAIVKAISQRGGDLLKFHIPSEAQLPIGAKVRIKLEGLVSEEGQRKRNAFTKEFATLSFSSQVWEVVGFKRTNPVISYTVRSLDGNDTILPFSFTRNQLAIVSLPFNGSRD